MHRAGADADRCIHQFMWPGVGSQGGVEWPATRRRLSQAAPKKKKAARLNRAASDCFLRVSVGGLEVDKRAGLHVRFARRRSSRKGLAVISLASIRGTGLAREPNGLLASFCHFLTIICIQMIPRFVRTRTAVPPLTRSTSAASKARMGGHSSSQKCISDLLKLIGDLMAHNVKSLTWGPRSSAAQQCPRRLSKGILPHP